MKIWGSSLSEATWLLALYTLQQLPLKSCVLLRVAALTFEMFLVSLQLGGQQATKRPQTAECRHHRVFIIHVGIVIALPAAQTTTETRQGHHHHLLYIYVCSTL